MIGGCSAATPNDQNGPPPCTLQNDLSTAAWEHIDAGSFSFRIPPGYVPEPVQGIDSRVGHYRRESGGAEVSYDLGMYSNDLSQHGQYAEYQACSEVIGARPATVVTGVLRDTTADGGRLVAAAAWRNLSGGATPVHLTMWTTARDSSELELLHAVLRSVRFDPGQNP